MPDWYAQLLLQFPVVGLVFAAVIWAIRHSDRLWRNFFAEFKETTDRHRESVDKAVQRLDAVEARAEVRHAAELDRDRRAHHTHVRTLRAQIRRLEEINRRLTRRKGGRAMTTEAWVARYVLWAVAAVILVWILRRTDRQMTERQAAVFARLAERDRRLDEWVDGIDARAEARAAEYERREAERIAGSEEATGADDFEDDLDELVDAELFITVRLPAGTSTGELADVYREVQTATRGRFPVHIGPPVPPGDVA